MTKREHGERQRMIEALSKLSFSQEEAEELRRISMTLRRWGEEECNGTIQRDEETGKPRRYYENRMGEHIRGEIIPDREAGALKRLAKIVARHAGCVAYHQTDPRGCALYIVPEDALCGAPVDQVYTRGVAVY